MQVYLIYESDLYLATVLGKPTISMDNNTVIVEIGEIKMSTINFTASKMRIIWKALHVK